MSFTCACILLLAFHVLFKSAFGSKNHVSNYEPPKSDKDIERLKEIAEYDRWEKAGRKDT